VFHSAIGNLEIELSKLFNGTKKKKKKKKKKKALHAVLKNCAYFRK
jgi:hypothetical protein